MKKFLFGTAGLLLIAASCSKNEVVEVNQDGNEIQFSVVANKATKAAEIYDNSNFKAFKVYAETADSDPAIYINGDNIEKNTSNVWENKSGLRFWPEASLNFYALQNAPANFKFTAGTAPTFEFTVENSVAAQKDLVYAVSMNQSRETTVTGSADEDPVVVEGAPVELNFRHALSQIVFQAKNTNPNLYVEVHGVKVVNVTGKEIYTLPKITTSNIIVEEGENAGGATDPVNDDSRRSWAGTGTKNVTYEISSVTENKPVELVGATAATPSKLGGTTAHSMMLIPQTTTAWVPTDQPTPAKQTGSYLMVNCVIWNVAGESFNENTDLVIWGAKGEGEDAPKYTAEPAWVAIPATFEWKEGFKYIYTFIFDKGAGYDPNPGVDPDPQPAIIPISFEVTVDDFNVVNSDIDMDVPEQITTIPGGN